MRGRLVACSFVAIAPACQCDAPQPAPPQSTEVSGVPAVSSEAAAASGNAGVEGRASGAALFDADVGHPFNRLHTALFSRAIAAALPAPTPR